MKAAGLRYKGNVDSTLERLRELYEKRAQDRIFARFEIPSRVLSLYLEKQPPGFCSYPDPRQRISFWDEYLKERRAIEDDSMPAAYLSELDQGLYGGAAGGQVQYMRNENGWVSSMVTPILKDWSEFDSLSFSEANLHYRRYIDQLDVFVQGAAGKFGISHFILIDGLNFVFELVGATKTYESLIGAQRMVRKATAFAFELNLRIQNYFFSRVPLFAGGTFSNMAQWIPGRIVSESLDPFHMTSVQYFEHWGRENIERMLARFDGGVIHLHGNGRHLLEAACSIPGVKAIWLGDDRGHPPAFEVLSQLRKRAADMPLVVSVDYNDFTAKLQRHRLCGGVCYRVTDTPDADQANRCMEAVLGYRC